MRQTITAVSALGAILVLAAGSLAQQSGASYPPTGVQQPQYPLPAQPGAAQTPGATSQSAPSGAAAVAAPRPAYLPTPPTPGGPAPTRPPVGLSAPQAMFGPGSAAAVPQSTAPAAAPYINPFASAQGSISSVPTIQPNVPTAPSVLPDKPFAGYVPPSPVSPYLNLYRFDNDFGAINNYYTLVQPMVRQQAYNQQLQNELRAVEAATRLQSQSINQLDQRTNYLYGVPSGGSYMNYGGFYPGYQPPASPGRQ